MGSWVIIFNLFLKVLLAAGCLVQTQELSSFLSRQNRCLIGPQGEIFLDMKMVVQMSLSNNDSNENGKETSLD